MINGFIYVVIHVGEGLFLFALAFNWRWWHLQLRYSTLTVLKRPGGHPLLAFRQHVPTSARGNHVFSASTSWSLAKSSNFFFFNLIICISLQPICWSDFYKVGLCTLNAFNRGLQKCFDPPFFFKKMYRDQCGPWSNTDNDKSPLWLIFLHNDPTHHYVSAFLFNLMLWFYPISQGK